MTATAPEPLIILPPFAFSVLSSELAVRDALKGLITGLEPLSLDVEEIGTVELVMAEALNNIVEHAYPEDVDAGPIAVACAHQTDGLHMTIRDQGRAMPDGQAPIGMAQNVDVDVMDMPEGGFGWFLIQNLAKDIRYDRMADENRLDLRIAVAIRRAR